MCSLVMSSYLYGWNNGFVNLTQLLFLCEKTGALAIVELGLMTGRQADVNRQLHNTNAIISWHFYKENKFRLN